MQQNGQPMMTGTWRDLGDAGPSGECEAAQTVMRVAAAELHRPALALGAE